MAVSDALRREVRDLDGDRRAYCLSPAELSVAAYEVDHIVPSSAGGEDVLGNLAWTCPACNRAKGARQLASDPTTGLLVSLFHPRRDTWTVHFAWVDDGVLVAGLTDTGRATVELLQMNRPQLARLRRIWRKIGIRLDE